MPCLKNYPSHLASSPIGCPETLVRNYHCSLSNCPEKRSSQCWCLSSINPATEWPNTKYVYKTSSRAREIHIKNKNVHLELVSDTKLASGFVTDKGCLWDTFTRNYCPYHDRQQLQQFTSTKMLLFLIKPWTMSILRMKPCASKSPTQETIWTPKEQKTSKYLSSYLPFNHRRQIILDVASQKCTLFMPLPSSTCRVIPHIKTTSTIPAKYVEPSLKICHDRLQKIILVGTKRSTGIMSTEHSHCLTWRSLICSHSSPRLTVVKCPPPRSQQRATRPNRSNGHLPIC